MEQENGNESPIGNVGTPLPNMEQKSVGAVIGTIIIIVLLVVGGIYFFTARKAEAPIPTPEEILQTQDATTTALERLGTSDNVGDIEIDINNTDLGSIDAELQDIDTEFSN